MGKAKRTILAAACAAALVVGSVAATVAYLTSTDTVTNTFTVGNVSIKLDEAKVNADGDLVKVGEDGKETVVQDIADATRVDANTYKLLPGHEYVKDPTVTVASGSENCWLFVKFEEKSDPSTYLDYTSTLTAANGWTQGDGTSIPENVWYREVGTSNTTLSWGLLSGNKISVKDTVTNANMSAAANAQLVYTAYAIQKDGFAEAATAWAEVYGTGE